MRIIVKAPGEKTGHYEEIDGTSEDSVLSSLQETVGGYIATVRVSRSPSVFIICNEEGKLQELAPNLVAGETVISGTVAVCGLDGTRLSGCPISLKEWEGILDGDLYDIQEASHEK